MATSTDSQVGDDEGDEHGEERGRERREAERVVERALGDQGADGHDGEDRGEQRPRRAAPEERDSPGADDEHDEGLGGERLDEPAGAELGRGGVEDPEHDGEGGEVEHRADRAEADHEPADEADVPVRRAGELFLVDAVGGDGHLAGVVEQVVEQDLEREHRQERQERGGDGDAEHVPEVRRRAHEHVLDGVGEDAASFGDAVGEHVEVAFEQDDVGGVLGDVGGRVDRDPDVGVVQRERVVDAVAEERDRRAGVALGAQDAGLLLGADPGEDRGVGRRRR